MPPRVSLVRGAVVDPVRQHDHPGAGAVRRHPVRDPLLQRLEQLERAGQLGHRRRLAARQHERVDAVELLGPAHARRPRARRLQRAQVLADVALEGEHADRGRLAAAVASTHDHAPAYVPLRPHPGPPSPPALPLVEGRGLSDISEGPISLHRWRLSPEASVVLARSHESVSGLVSRKPVVSTKLAHHELIS